MDWKAVQLALQQKGFDPKGIDGIPGRNTIAALKLYQTFAGLPATGEADFKTLSALGLNGYTKPELPWLAVLNGKMGLNENRDNSILRKFLKSDGRSVGDPSKLPWCGDLVETIIALSLPNEVLPSNPYLARNWSKFGVATPPAYGAVASFWRGDPNGINGHVAILVGQNSQAYRVRGGNQSNSISDTWIAKNRLIAARKPATWAQPLPPLPTLTASGAVSTNEV